MYFELKHVQKKLILLYVELCINDNNMKNIIYVSHNK